MASVVSTAITFMRLELPDPPSRAALRYSYFLTAPKCARENSQGARFMHPVPIGVFDGKVEATDCSRARD